MIEYDHNSQVPREINVKSVPHCKVITQQLQRDNVQEALQAVHCLWHADRFATAWNALIIFTAYDDWLCLPCGDLRERRLHLGVERILCHDDDNGHVFVNESKRSVLELSGKDAFRMHVGNFFDLQSAL